MKIAGVFLGVVAAVIAGCGEVSIPSLPDPVPATGVVTFRGQPLKHALVEFIPRDGTPGPGSTATTDESGSYELITRIGPAPNVVKGAIPGGYRVRVSLMTTPDGQPVQVASDQPPADLGAIEKLPLRYSGYNETELSGTVAPGGGTVELKLM